MIESGTKRGGRLYLIDGLGFVKNVTNGDKTYLHCRHRAKMRCRASAVLDGRSDQMTAYGEHSCDAAFVSEADGAVNFF